MSSAASPARQPAPEPHTFLQYAAAFTAYVVLGMLTKSFVLNWIVGPLWLVLVLHVLPRSLRRLSRRGR